MQVLSGSQAIVILSELSPGGALMKGTSHQELNRKSGGLWKLKV